MGLLDKLRQRAGALKTETLALYFAARDPRTPWYAKLLAAAIVAYAFSPVDLIPDFIPVLGYLDDLVLVPLGIALAIRLVPPAVLEECRARARDTRLGGKPAGWIAAAVIILIWGALVGLVVAWVYRSVAADP
jgi:uncharacterized membrane protein YkvA (DUF1232 family)